MNTLPSISRETMFRVYNNVKTWLHYDLKPDKWDRKMKHNLFFPIRTIEQPAPD